MKNRYLHILPIFIFILITSFLWAQSVDNKYDLLLLSGTVHPVENVNELAKMNAGADETINGKYYRIIQFFEIPSDEEKQELKSNGVELLNYLPNFAFFAAIDHGTALNTANARGNIRTVIPISPDYKIHPLLKNNNLPEDAEVVCGKADLTLNYFKGIPAPLFIKELKSKIRGIKILSKDDESQWVKVRVKKELVVNLSLVSCIQYVEPIDKSKVENNSGTTGHRSNAINTFIAGGLRYDGTGVGVSIGDDGEYFLHIDYVGRTQFGVSPGAGHSTGVAGILAGAGNINPKYRGHAPGVNLIYRNWHYNISALNIITPLYNGPDKIRVTNHSLGEATNAGYTNTARQADLQVESLPSLFNVHSAGNQGPGYRRITGGYKVGKNAIAVGAVDYRDAIANYSSRGPSRDGRIKPDICAKGTNFWTCRPSNLYRTLTGTSMSSPAAAGCFAQLIHAYRDLNAGSDPTLALLKGIVLNTAKDLGRAGPDYVYGWGRINVWKAYNVIKDQRYVSSTVANGANNAHTITVPANVQELKVMIYWADPAAAAGVSKALINDLDITLAFAGQTYNPWVLNSSSPNSAATKGQDRDNNMEQISVTSPASGVYTLTVNGFQVPQGPQEYWVIYEFLTDEIKVTYPIGGESFVPGVTEYIRWDAQGITGNFTVEYSADAGATWTTLSSNVGRSRRYYTWNVPSGSALTGEGLIRVSSGGKSGVSDTQFSIIRVPTNLRIAWRCPTNFKLTWNAVTGATSYEVFLLGQKYMESQGTTSNLDFIVTSPSSAITWASVRALSNSGQTIGRRAVAIRVGTGTSSCPPISVNEINEASPYGVSVSPNPMNESAIVSAYLPNEETISVKLMDVFGKEVATLVDKKKLPRGEHQFVIDQILSNGIYFIVIKGNSGTSFGKIVVTKN